MIETDKIDSFIRTWSEKKTINGKSFDQMFDIEGVPLWWFYRRFFVKHVMPKPINSFDLIYENKKLTVQNKIKFFVASKFLKRYFMFNENRKINNIKRTKNYSKEKKALFLTYTNYLMKDKKIFRIQKIIDQLDKDKKIKSFTLFTDPLSSRNYKKIAKLNNIYQYYDEAIAEEALITATEMHKRWEEIDDKTKFRALKTGSRSLWPYLKYSFDFFMSAEFLYFLILYYEIFKKILEKQNIKVIVLNSQNSLFEKCILAAAKKLNVDSMIIQHGIGGFGVNPDLIAKTKMLVFGDFYKKRLLNYGVDKNSIHCVGPIIFDEINEYVGSKTTKGKNILIATNPTINSFLLKREEYFKRIGLILKSIKKIKDAKITFKLHPREVPTKTFIEDYNVVLKKEGYNDAKVFGGDINRSEFYTLIKKCDVFVNFGSTAAIEAMIIGKPVVTINLFASGHKNKQVDKWVSTKSTGWIEKENISVNLGYRGDVASAIQGAMRDKKLEKRTKKYIKDKYGRIDGKAYERAAKIIEKI